MSSASGLKPLKKGKKRKTQTDRKKKEKNYEEMTERNMNSENLCTPTSLCTDEETKIVPKFVKKMKTTANSETDKIHELDIKETDIKEKSYAQENENSQKVCVDVNDTNTNSITRLETEKIEETDARQNENKMVAMETIQVSDENGIVDEEITSSKLGKNDVSRVDDKCGENSTNQNQNKGTMGNLSEIKVDDIKENIVSETVDSKIKQPGDGKMKEKLIDEKEDKTAKDNVWREFKSESDQIGRESDKKVKNFKEKNMPTSGDCGIILNAEEETQKETATCKTEDGRIQTGAFTVTIATESGDGSVNENRHETNSEQEQEMTDIVNGVCEDTDHDNGSGYSQESQVFEVHPDLDLQPEEETTNYVTCNSLVNTDGEKSALNMEMVSKEIQKSGDSVEGTTDTDDITDSQLCAMDWTEESLPRKPQNHATPAVKVLQTPKLTHKEITTPTLPSGTTIVKGLIQQLSQLNVMILRTKCEIESTRRQRIQKQHRQPTQTTLHNTGWFQR